MANKRRPQGDGTIRKRSDGRWEARIIVGHKNDGSPMYKSAFAKTQKSALKQLHQLIDLYRDVDLTEDSRMTLGEWLDKWLDEYMIFTIREGTLDSYHTMVKNQVKPGTGCVTMINDHLYEGRFSPRVNGKRIAKNIYATTREECEEKLKVLIAEMKKEIAEIKVNAKNEG